MLTKVRPSVLSAVPVPTVAFALACIAEIDSFCLLTNTSVDPATPFVSIAYSLAEALALAIICLNCSVVTAPREQASSYCKSAILSVSKAACSFNIDAFNSS